MKRERYCHNAVMSQQLSLVIVTPQMHTHTHTPSHSLHKLTKDNIFITTTCYDVGSIKDNNT